MGQRTIFNSINLFGSGDLHILTIALPLSYALSPSPLFGFDDLVRDKIILHVYIDINVLPRKGR